MRFGLILLALARLCFAADAKNNLSDAEIDDIIQKFAAKEAAFAQARDNYMYRQTARIQELDDAGNTTGRWEMVSDIVFSSDGKRTEHVVRSPVPTLQPDPAHARRYGGSAQRPALRSAPPASSRITGSATWATRRWTKSGTYVFAVKPKKVEGRNATFQARSGWTIAICRS